MIELWLRYIPSRGRHATSSSCSLLRSESSSLLPPLRSVSPGNKHRSTFWIRNVVCVTCRQYACRLIIFNPHIQVSTQPFTKTLVVMCVTHSTSAVRHKHSACLPLFLSVFGLMLLRRRILDLQLGAESLWPIRRSGIARSVQGWECALEWEVKHKALKLRNTSFSIVISDLILWDTQLFCSPNFFIVISKPARGRISTRACWLDTPSNRPNIRHVNVACPDWTAALTQEGAGPFAKVI